MADQGVGLYCSPSSAGIERDQVLFSIPNDAILTAELPPGIVSHPEGISGMSRLALRLVYEKSLSQASPFAPYLRLLPSLDDIDLPILWPPSLVDFLQPSQLYDDVFEHRKESEEELEVCRQRLQLPDLAPWLTWEHWSWARAIVMSRPYLMVCWAQIARGGVQATVSQQGGAPDLGLLWGLLVQQLVFHEQPMAWGARQRAHWLPFADRIDMDDDSTLKLIPLVDMLNHDDTVTHGIQPGDGIFTSRDSIALVADRTYPPDSQIYGSYGTINAADKFFSFGYVESVQVGDSLLPSQGTAIFRVRVSEDDPLYEWKAAILKSILKPVEGEAIDVSVVVVRGEEGGGTVKVVFDERTGGLEKLEQYLRLVVAGEEFKEEQSGSLSEDALRMIWGRLRDPLVSATEARVGMKVVRLCQAELARVDEQLGRVQVGGGSVMEDRRSRRRLGMLGRYLHGELLAFRAVAEHYMAAVESLLSDSDPYAAGGAYDEEGDMKGKDHS